MTFDIYEVRRADDLDHGEKKYAITRSYDGKFLEWCDLATLCADYGDPEINEQSGCEGSVIVAKKQAESIVKKIAERYVKNEYR